MANGNGLLIMLDNNYNVVTSNHGNSSKHKPLRIDSLADSTGKVSQMAMAKATPSFLFPGGSAPLRAGPLFKENHKFRWWDPLEQHPGRSPSLAPRKMSDAFLHANYQVSGCFGCYGHWNLRQLGQLCTVSLDRVFVSIDCLDAGLMSASFGRLAHNTCATRHHEVNHGAGVYLVLRIAVVRFADWKIKG